MTFQKSVSILGAVLAAAFAQQAAASGYHFGTQSVTAQSTANSSAAEAADATGIFYNPAALTKLESSEVTAALNLVAPYIRYEATEAKHIAGTDVRGGSRSGKITKNVVAAPHIYGAYKLNDRVTLGLGVYVPFGSATEYEKDSVLRYNMNKLGLTSIAIEPVAAFKASDRHSFGVGLIVQHSSAELRKFADWGAARNQPLPNGETVNLAGMADGVADVKGKDWGFGYHLAWLYDINDKARVGVNYRSKVDHELKGTAKWDAASPLAAAQRATIAQAGFVPSEDASVKIVTPESLSVHGMYRVNNQLNVFGDVTWTRHSRFNTVDLYFANPKMLGVNPQTGTPVTSNKTTLKPNWRDTYKVAVGASYQYSEPLQLRAGVAFDQSPVRNADERMATLPDGNRVWFSAGVKYTHAKRHVFDLAYSHIHINDTEMRGARATGTDVDSKGTVAAKFKNYANIVGVQYSYKF